jgi:MFS family permease
MAQIVFKPVAGGYIYRAPNPWLFGRGPHYRVDEAQKAELAGRHRSMLRTLFWLIVAGGALGGPLAAGFLGDHGWKTLAVCGLIGLVIGAVVNFTLVLKVRPILAGLTPTTETMTQGDVLKRQADVFSPRFVIGFMTLSLAMLALVASRGIFDGWDPNTVFGTLLFGACTAYWIVLYVMKRMRAAA